MLAESTCYVRQRIRCKQRITAANHSSKHLTTSSVDDDEIARHVSCCTQRWLHHSTCSVVHWSCSSVSLGFTGYTMNQVGFVTQAAKPRRRPMMSSPLFVAHRVITLVVHQRYIHKHGWTLSLQQKCTIDMACRAKILCIVTDVKTFSANHTCMHY